ncbi:MAG: hypothetical protein KC877_04475 [Candidatus Kaiserbacteria bacterium]|nr:hypothetical protein [Candidatus Kaiserbacteria bacterium]
MIGQMGSGKSTLTRKIAQKCSVPRLELDRLWFENGGHDCLVNGCTEEKKQQIKERTRKAVSDFLSENEEWVVDGTHSKIQPLIAEKADAVVLIQRPILKRLLSHVVRVFKGKDRHPEVSWWKDLLHTKVIFDRWRQNRHDTQMDAAAAYQDKLVVLSSFKEIDHYFNSLG